MVERAAQDAENEQESDARDQERNSGSRGGLDRPIEEPEEHHSKKVDDHRSPHPSSAFDVLDARVPPVVIAVAAAMS